MKKLITFLAILLLGYTASATGWYVSTTGSDSNSGTVASPYLTIQKGIDDSSSGDTVYVISGTYKEYVAITKNGIVLRNYKNDVVTVDAENTRTFCVYADDVYGFQIIGINALNATISNFNFHGAYNFKVKNCISTLPVATDLTNVGYQLVSSETHNCNDIELNNVTSIGGGYGVYCGSGKINRLAIYGGLFTKAYWDGLNITCETIADTSKYIKNVIIDGAETSYNLRQGIATATMVGLIIKNVNTHHNGATGIQLENYVTNSTIEDCYFHDNSQNPQFTFETGLWVDYCTNVKVRRCKMQNNQTGFRTVSCTGVLLENCLIYGNQDGYSDTNAAGIDLSSSEVAVYNCVIEDNSLYDSNAAAVRIRNTGEVKFKNNIVHNNRSQYDLYRTGTNTLESDYNIFYNSDRPISIYNVSEILTWEQFKTAGLDKNSINLDPQFVGIGNYKLLPTSPAINTGTDVGVTTDYEKSIRSIPMEMGAYNYSSTADGWLTDPNGNVLIDSNGTIYTK